MDRTDVYLRDKPTTTDLLYDPGHSTHRSTRSCQGGRATDETEETRKMTPVMGALLYLSFTASAYIDCRDRCEWQQPVREPLASRQKLGEGRQQASTGSGASWTDHSVLSL